MMIKKILFIFLISLNLISCDNASREFIMSGNGEETADESVPDETLTDETAEKDNIEPDESVEPDEVVVPDENETPDIVEVPDENTVDTGTYYVESSRCNGCRRCIGSCSYGALSMSGFKAVIDPLKCTGCGDCVARCPRGAIKKSN